MKSMKAIFFLGIILLSASMVLQPAIIANESCSGFVPDQCSSTGGNNNNSWSPGFPVIVQVPGYPLHSPSIGQLIAEGGSFFLQSQGNMNSLLSQVELSEINQADYQQMRDLLYQAIGNMLNASDRYYHLHLISATLPYNEKVIARLVCFNYDDFMREKGLNPVIFNAVKRLLSRGDIRGVYNHLSRSSEALNLLLEELRESIEYNQLPDLETLWRINQEYCRLNLYGQYVAQVFYRVNAMK